MNIIFTQHVRLKMRERKILKRHVLETVERFDAQSPSYNGREERYRKYGRRYLKVIVRNEAGSIVVITTHWVVKVKSE